MFRKKINHHFSVPCPKRLCLLVWLGLDFVISKKPAFSLSQEEAEEGQGQTRTSFSLATNRGQMEMTECP